MAKPMSRLQIAQRIHQVLLREIGHAIEPERLLAEPRYARDVLLVCDALPGSELATLATRFRLSQAPAASPAPAAMPAAAAPGHTRQPTDWSRDTSGFGVTHPPPVEGAEREPGLEDDAQRRPQAERRRNWLPRWRE
jgi:hypothetical protein